MIKAFNAYLGKAGHLRVMSEFLIRGWNVAIPEVDVGDDIFVVEDETGVMRRVQVKSATAVKRDGSFSAQFSIRASQVRVTAGTFVHYVFIVRNGSAWTEPILVRQDALRDHLALTDQRPRTNGSYTVYSAFVKGAVTFNGSSWKKYLGNFEHFPSIEH